LQVWGLQASRKLNLGLSHNGARVSSGTRCGAATQMDSIVTTMDFAATVAAAGATTMVTITATTITVTTEDTGAVTTTATATVKTKSVSIGGLRTRLWAVP
jgi:hypothetical protein